MDFTVFTTITIEILKAMSHFLGSYGMSIIAITVLVRLIMWPLNVSQQKSMKKMQMLQPKLKELQNRYKNDPQLMQKKMMEFYKENSFNPFGGCLPLLIQMPVFILLYSALMSPAFMNVAGKTSFFFINSLNSTWKSHAGVSGDKVFGVREHDRFIADKTATVYTKNGVIQNVEIKDADKAVETQGVIVPGKPVDLKMNFDKLNLSLDQLKAIEKVEVTLSNYNTKEVEHITFNSNKDIGLLTSTVKTEKDKEVYHFDVLALIALFGFTMWASQKVMTATTNTDSMDPAQKVMQEQMGKMMPIMITFSFIMFPFVPAGVLLYMVVSNIIQVIQTVVINKGLDKHPAFASVSSSSVPSDARTVTVKNANESN